MTAADPAGAFPAGAPAARPKFAMYWAAACGGCEIAVLNLHEAILEIDSAFEIAFWPVAMDVKYADVEALPDGAILLTLFNGAIRNVENEAMARLLRRKSKLLVAFGACACQGGIPGLANLSRLDDLIDTAYSTVTTENPVGIRPESNVAVPEGDLRLPALTRFVKTLDQVVPVDYYIPGCPPETPRIAAVIDVVLKVIRGEADLPPSGATLGAGDSTVCDECRRDRNVKTIREFRRLQQFLPDPDLCMLEQGVPCSGPATRSGCGALCPAAGTTCMGCYGPAEGVADMGARLISAYASVIESDDPDEIDRILDGIPDPVGQCYRFGMAGSLLRAARAAWNGAGNGTNKTVDR